MVDISKEAVERLAKDCDSAQRDHQQFTRQAHLHYDCATTLRALSARIASVEARQPTEEQVEAVAKVKPLVWLGGGTRYHSDGGEFAIYRLEGHRRKVFRLIQADLGTQYRGDFGGDDAVQRAKELAETINIRSTLSALETLPPRQPTVQEAAKVLLDNLPENKGWSHNSILTTRMGQSALRALSSEQPLIAQETDT